MQTRTGRLIDHVHLIARDFAKTKLFYRAVLEALDRSADAVTITRSR